VLQGRSGTPVAVTEQPTRRFLRRPFDNPLWCFFPLPPFQLSFGSVINKGNLIILKAFILFLFFLGCGGVEA
jgi:hypothetical protein